MGTSALYICQAFADNGFKSALHTAVDPNQDTQYKSIGRNHVKRAGLESTFALMHEPSYVKRTLRRYCCHFCYYACVSLLRRLLLRSATATTTTTTTATATATATN